MFENRQKVAFNIASETSYVYILSGQKFIKNAKNGQFWQVFENLSLWSNSVTRQVTINKTQIGGKCQIEKFKWDIFGDFQILCDEKWYHPDTWSLNNFYYGLKI